MNICSGYSHNALDANRNTPIAFYTDNNSFHPFENTTNNAHTISFP